MELLENVKQDIEKYIGIYKTTDTDLEQMLYAFVSKYGERIYLENQMLSTQLRVEGFSEMDTLKICLMTKVTGFKELISKDERVQQSDLDRFIKNAVDETGFNRYLVMELTCAIMKSLGMVFDFSKMDIKESVLKETAYVIPKSVYESELSRFEQDFRKFQNGEKRLDELEFSRLEPLAAAGISKAKYYLGVSCLLGKKNSEMGCSLLKEAAEAGDIEAAATLGDYYYDRSGSDFWGMAYDYYTGYGSLALNEKRREAITAIINHKTYNMKILFMSGAFLVILFVSYILALGSESFHPHYIWGGICMLLELGVVVTACLHYRIRPYDNVLYVPFFMFIVWFFYIAIRLLF